MTRPYDYAVIGGGIVGLAVAKRLLEVSPGASVLILEKETQVAAHQTGHNSGVIHAGIYYRPGSLKAKLCKAGAIQTRRFCDENAIPYRNTGKLIVATNDVEAHRMNELHERAISNELDVSLISPEALREREPNVTGVGALFLASTGIVDYRRVCQAMAKRIEGQGGRVELGARVVSIHESLSEVAIDTPAERFYARRLVVAGGIQADRLARMAGLTVNFRMVPFRGEYYRLPDARNDIVSTLIYPVPDPDLPFLGVHLTLMMDGGVTVGPNAVVGFAREGYAKGSVDWTDLKEMARFVGFWRVARSQLKTGLMEQWNSVYKPGYLELVRKYCPSLTVNDLLPEPAGIRAQAVTTDGVLVEDFLFLQTERMLHVCNAPSPAATSAMPIAEVVVDRLLGSVTGGR